MTGSGDCGLTRTESKFNNADASGIIIEIVIVKTIPISNIGSAKLRDLAKLFSLNIFSVIRRGKNNYKNLFCQIWERGAPWIFVERILKNQSIMDSKIQIYDYRLKEDLVTTHPSLLEQVQEIC
jgi:hypothetical protein